MSKPTACIIGYGRFGKVLKEALEIEFGVLVLDRLTQEEAADTIARSDYIFPCVPIQAFKSVMIELVQYLKPGQTVVDVCSVKLYPESIFKAHLPEGVNAILTHPLFGPDSYNEPKARKIMMCPVGEKSESYETLKAFFERTWFKVVEMTADEHDIQAAHSQVATHFIGRVFEQAGIEASPDITTLGFEKLLEVKEQTCHDSPELFAAMVFYNPHARAVIQKITDAALGVAKL